MPPDQGNRRASPPRHSPTACRRNRHGPARRGFRDRDNRPRAAPDRGAAPRRARRLPQTAIAPDRCTPGMPCPRTSSGNRYRRSARCGGSPHAAGPAPARRSRRGARCVARPPRTRARQRWRRRPGGPCSAAPDRCRGRCVGSLSVRARRCELPGKCRPWSPAGQCCRRPAPSRPRPDRAPPRQEPPPASPGSSRKSASSASRQALSWPHAVRPGCCRTVAQDFKYERNRARSGWYRSSAARSWRQSARFPRRGPAGGDSARKTCAWYPIADHGDAPQRRW